MRQYVPGSGRGTLDNVSTTTGYLMSSDSLVVHKVTCPALRGGSGDRWASEWRPDDKDHRHERPCRRCLPDGVPGVLDATPAPPKADPRRMTMREMQVSLAEAADLLQDARPAGHDPGNNRRWGRRRKALIDRLIDAEVWPR